MIKKLIDEGTSLDPNCNLCNEGKLDLGETTKYGAKIIYKVGNLENGWFATLSPRTGGDPDKDFTIQLMPIKHLTHFCQISKIQELSRNYGVAFAKLSQAMTKMMADKNQSSEVNSETREESISMATYGKCTNWKEKKEHLHIKLFPFRGSIGQPYTVDSSFGKKKIFTQNNEEYVKMKPVKKVGINDERVEKLSKELINYLR